MFCQAAEPFTSPYLTKNKQKALIQFNTFLFFSVYIIDNQLLKKVAVFIFLHFLNGINC